MRTVKVRLGTFACNGIESCLSSDVPAAISAALGDAVEKLRSGEALPAIPGLALREVAAEPVLSVDLSVDEETEELMGREAGRQGATVSQLATHSVLIYLAELDRLTPPDLFAAA